MEINTDEEPMLFKAQLFALTGVQPERQKVMLKGMTLKDEDWGNIKLKDVSDNNKNDTIYILVGCRSLVRIFFGSLPDNSTS